jgi:methanogenesis imperfect marker protein 11
MSKILEKRKLCIGLVRRLTDEVGSFTVQDIIFETGLPRSTVQDWMRRLLEEQQIDLVEGASGRKPARYSFRSKPSLPYSACKRIFTTIDPAHEIGEIYHSCSSEGAVMFCAFTHKKAEGAITCTRYEGLMLREKFQLGRTLQKEIDKPTGSSVVVERVDLQGDKVVQTLKAFGGPAHSLTETMKNAKGVLRIELEEKEGYTEGKIFTDPLEHLTIGIDDTDTEDAGATWALSLSLLDHLGESVEKISHKVVMLNPNIKYKTAGNAASFLEIAIDPSKYDEIINKSIDFLKTTTLSENTAVAVLHGLNIPNELKKFANSVRAEEVKIDDALKTAEKCEIDVFEVTGKMGIVGAVASLAFFESNANILMDASANL